MVHVFYNAHTEGDLQKVARECPPTDHMIMQYTWTIFICWIYREISAPGHASGHLIGRNLDGFDHLGITPFYEPYENACECHCDT